MTWILKGPVPYKVQLEAQQRSKGHSRWGHFLEMGLGKTPLILNEIATDCPEIDTFFVLCPNSFKGGWQSAPGEWGMSVATRVWPQQEPVPGCINILNYEAIRSKGWAYVAQIMDERPCGLIIDESSAIKSHRSLTAKAVLDLSKRAKWVRLLNGTPLTQNVLDLYSQLKCLGELDKVNAWQFRNRYALLGGWMGKQIVGTRNEEELRRILSRCSFRALKKDWLKHLPEKIYQSVPLEMTGTQKRHYKEMKEDFITFIQEHGFKAEIILTKLEKMRQITSGILIDGERIEILVEPLKNPKMIATCDLIENGSGKVIICYFYKAVGDMIFDIMKDQKYRPARVMGGLTPQQVEDEKRRFNTDPECRVLVGQIGAISKGHTLVGDAANDRCSTMVFFDNTFSLLDRAQVEDRIHRGEQDRACNYFDLVMSDIDLKIAQALQQKRDLAAAIVDAVRALP